MTDYLSSMLPVNEDEKLVVTTEMLVLSVQVALQKEMTTRGISQSKLAEKLGMSPSRISQIFSEGGPNLTLKTIARVAAALDSDLELALVFRHNNQAATSDLGQHEARAQWTEDSAANDTHAPKSTQSRVRKKISYHRHSIWRDGELERRAA